MTRESLQPKDPSIRPFQYLDNQSLREEYINDPTPDEEAVSAVNHEAGLIRLGLNSQSTVQEARNAATQARERLRITLKQGGAGGQDQILGDIYYVLSSTGDLASIEEASYFLLSNASLREIQLNRRFSS